MGLLLPRHGGKALRVCRGDARGRLTGGGQVVVQQVRPWIYHILLHWALSPCNGGGPKNLKLYVTMPSCVSVDFSVNPAWVSRASTPRGKELCG